MSDSKHAEVEEIEAVAKAVLGTGELMAEAAAYAAEADPDGYMWGVVGSPFAYLYFGAAMNIHMMLMRMPVAIEGVSKRIAAAAEAIATADDEAAGEFDGIAGDVERG